MPVAVREVVDDAERERLYAFRYAVYVDEMHRMEPSADHAHRRLRDGLELGVAEGISLSFIDCNAPLKPFFERLGFRQVFPDFVHPVYGRVHPLVLAVHDREHLTRVKSPFPCPGLPDGHPSIQRLTDLAEQPVLHATGAAASSWRES